jgi:hypothetical protein
MYHSCFFFYDKVFEVVKVALRVAWITGKEFPLRSAMKLYETVCHFSVIFFSSKKAERDRNR